MAGSASGGYGYALLHAAQTWRTEASAVLKPFGLTVPQFLVTMALYRQARHGWPPLAQGDVAARLGMDANTASQIVTGLERRGLIVRERHFEDARIRVLSLTPGGLATAKSASAAARGFNDRYFGVLSEAQLVALDQILETLSTQSTGRS
jgi:DNA-binding MarR family transcriptional regulator